MPRPPTSDEVLFAPLQPSAIARAERAASGDPEVATEVSEGRDVVQALARTAEPAAAPSGLRSRIVSSAARRGKYGRYADRIARMFDVDLAEAERLLVLAEDPKSFGPGPVPNTTWLFVTPGPKYAGALAAIGRLEVGARVPDHGHGGDELTLVLDGGFAEDGGAEVWRGDELYKAGGSEHTFAVVGDEPCIAAVRAVGGVTFKDGTKV